jgi:hypothetical protein
MEYARRSIFAHLSLFMTCLSKKTQTRPKLIMKFHEKPELPTMCGDLETDCVEIVAPETGAEIKIS